MMTLPSPTEMSARLDISKGYASDLLAGNKVPSLSLATRIHDAFGIPHSAWPLARKDAA